MRRWRGAIIGAVMGFIIGEVIVWAWTLLRGPVADEDLIAVWTTEGRILRWGAIVGCLIGVFFSRGREEG